MSLADELLADLEGQAAEEAPAPEQTQLEADIEALKGSNIKEIATLLHGEQLTRILREIEHFQQEERKQLDSGTVEDDPEYQLIVEANNILLEIDQEIGIVHKFVRDRYCQRFPELEQLVLNPIDYIRTVKTIQNDLDLSKVDLTEVLAPATIMVVSVTASTTQGKPLDDEDMANVLEACDIATGLLEANRIIFEYVESRMHFLSPNLTHICGATSAAKLLGAAGGLTALSKMPACNILVLGAQKKTLAGFSGAAALPHTGFVYYCELAQRQPADYRRKAARLIAAKCALAARVDSFNDGTERVVTIGAKLREDIEKKLEKAQEPPPASLPKPLPKPDEVRGKRRGGRRFRKLKEQRAETEAQKQANRLDFGKIEEDLMQEDLGFSLGRAAQNVGKFRNVVEKRKIGGTLSKKYQRELAKRQRTSALSTVRTPGGGASTAGTASVAFTPMQGLEIVNPKAAEQRVKEANEKYFGTSVGFQQVKSGGGAAAAAAASSSSSSAAKK